MVKGYEELYCRLPAKVEEMIQKRVFAIFKNVVDYDSFYSFIGMPRLSVEVVDGMLQAAVENSKRKKYHGTIEEVNEIPETED
jgi:hypothetical protein